ncbi:MAG: hypothetical protein K8T91_00685 [Planctomycetes bacterium]|nr:hypothetical protein [Planctomycetota bacterium]
MSDAAVGQRSSKSMVKRFIYCGAFALLYGFVAVVAAQLLFISGICHPSNKMFYWIALPFLWPVRFIRGFFHSDEFIVPFFLCWLVMTTILTVVVTIWKGAKGPPVQS